MENQKKKLNIAVFPWLAYGHIMPFFQVSKFLAQKGHQISFISTPKNLNRLPKPPQNISHLLTFVELHLPQIDGLPEGAESTSELPIPKVPFLKKAYNQLAPSLTQLLENSNFNWIVHDFLCPWVPRTATQLGINSAFFYISTATTLAFFGPPSGLLNGYPGRPEDLTVVPKWIDFPCDVKFKLHEVVSHQDCVDSDAPDFERFAETVQSCQLLVIRTSPEFESNSLSLLRKLYGKPVLPVGFLPPSLQENDPKLGDERWEKLKQWLDKKEENSVVYIALGSEVTLSRDLMHELAYGLEKSGLPFVWVLNIRPLVEEKLGEDIVPSGFETRVSGRGLVWRGWAPQLGILAHSAIGGFLTHCGWSSVIEALGFGKRLILLSGGNADLGLIARLLHGKGVGLEIPRDDKTGSFTSESVSELIRRVMVDKEGESVGETVKSMKEIFGSIELNNECLNELNRYLQNWPV
ncbi:hypothetical protein UlMin_022033 [Ulmus minor]